MGWKFSNRTVARLKAVAFIYKDMFNPQEETDGFENLIKKELGDLFDVYDKKFYDQIITGYVELKTALPSFLEKYVKDYDEDRITAIEKVIIYVGVIEFKHIKDIPGAVIINEAIEVSKVFGSRDSKKFVNAILDAVNKDINQKDR